MWKILNENDNFEISTDGEIRNSKTKKVKSLRIDNRGYYRVTLYKSGDSQNQKEKRGKTYQVHRLMALNFIDNIENKPVVNHKDGNKLNNKLENIEWATVSENTQHAFDIGLTEKPRGDKNPMSKLTEEDVLYIRNSKLKQSELALKFGVMQTTISRIKNYKLWKHLP